IRIKTMLKNQIEKIVTLDIFYDLLTANLAKNKLALNSIEAFLTDENSIGLNPAGGIELKVFSKDLEKAFEILSQ
ncbi:MAG: hypothetical protein ACXVDW_07045, partial [Bacteroidia bacterium]